MNHRPIIYQIFTRLFGNTKTNKKLWGTLEENGVGKFDDISDKALAEIKKMGITHVWYTGVIEHGVLTDYTSYGIPLDDADVVKGRAGSPYAIKDYYDVNPDLSTDVNNRMAEFEALIERNYKIDLKVIIDFVPNHVARKYHSDVKPKGIADLGENDDPEISFHEDNNFYYLPGTSFQVPQEYNSLGPNDFPTKDGFFEETPAKATGNNVFSPSPSIDDWFETVKLNYGVDFFDRDKCYFVRIPDTWKKMKDILLFWAGKGVDGFRCDMAEMVPVEFWEWVTNEVKNEYPDMVFIAESYDPKNYRNYLFAGGFDYLYDKVDLYDTLKRIIQKQGSTDELPQVWQGQEGIPQHMLRFLENHDEQRISSRFFAGDMHKGIPMMAAAAFMNVGPVMLYFGQEVGEPALGDSGFSGDDGRTTIFDYWCVPEHLKWMNKGSFDGGQLSTEQKQIRTRYIDILTACNEFPALSKGKFFDLHYCNRGELHLGYSDQVYAFLRHTQGQVLLIIINFNTAEESVNINIPEDFWNLINWNTKKTTLQMLLESHKSDKTFNPVTFKDKKSLIESRLVPLSYQVFEISG